MANVELKAKLQSRLASMGESGLTAGADIEPAPRVVPGVKQSILGASCTQGCQGPTQTQSLAILSRE